MTQTKKDSSPLGKLIVVSAEQFGCQVLQTTKQLWKHAEIFSFQKEKTRVKEDLLKWREDCNFGGNAISDEDSAFSIGDCANTTGLKTIHLYSYIKKKNGWYTTIVFQNNRHLK